MTTRHSKVMESSLVSSLAERMGRDGVCHVITLMRKSSIPGVVEIYSGGNTFRLALRTTMPSSGLSSHAGRGVILLMGEPLQGVMEGLRTLIEGEPALRGRDVVLHGSASNWRLDLSIRNLVRMRSASVHPLEQGEYVFWMGSEITGEGREGWATGELLRVIRHPADDSDLRQVLAHLQRGDLRAAAGVGPDASRVELNAAFEKIITNNRPERVSPAESEKRLDLHRRIYREALGAMRAAKAA